MVTRKAPAGAGASVSEFFLPVSSTTNGSGPLSNGCLPPELTERDQWVTWKEEFREGKPTKVPYVPGTTRRASHSNPQSWRSHKAANNAQPTRSHKAGIGFVFSAADPYGGIDLDGCRDPKTGEIAAWAREWIDQFDSYSEISPSGTGIKIIITTTRAIGRGRKRAVPGVPNSYGKRPAVEMYDRLRYFTLTGEHLDGTPTTIERRDVALARFRSTFFAEVPPVSPVALPPPGPMNLADAELLKKASSAKNGADFDRLWRGDTSGYGSHSEADLALCSHLAFWTGRDAGRIDRLFRQSGLMREKWERDDYREATIGTATAGCGEVYQPAPVAAVVTGAAAVATVAPVETKTLAEVIAVFKKWLHLPDPGYLQATLGAYAANLYPGDPLWFMNVGAPGSGKTEALAALSGLPFIRVASSLSGESSLLSGSAKRDRGAGATGGLLKQIGTFGVLVLKDFTSILAMRHEPRAQLLAALREIYDGQWTRDLGVDGGRTLSWAGKMGLVAACTQTIDTHHAVVAAMGERFIFYRLPRTEPEAQAKKALDLAGQEQVMRRELAEAVAGLFAGLNIENVTLALSDEEKAQLTELATLAAQCRSAVERDGYNREVVLIPDPEAPGRLAGRFQQFLLGLVAVGVRRDVAWRLVVKVAVDSMPALRWSALQHAAAQPDGLWTRTPEFAAALHHPESTVRRALEDLHGHGLLDRSVDYGTRWALTDWARAKFAALSPYLVLNQAGTPEKSHDGI